MQNGSAILENSLAVSHSHDPVFTIMGIYPREMKTPNLTRTCTQVALFMTAQTRNNL